MGLLNFNAILKRETAGAETTNSAKYTAVPIQEEIVSHPVQISYRFNADSEQSATDNIAAMAYPWHFNVAKTGPIVPGSVILQIGSELWFDDGAGHLLRNYNTTTGVGTILGTIDYTTTEAVIDDYAGRPITATVTPIACVIGEDWAVLKDTSFRTAAAPLRPNGFTVRADNPATNEQYNAQADNEGELSGDGVTGEVDLQKGLADISFPAPVLASSIFYNAVSYKQVPLDPEILGLDPVRLPANGRVPIMRDADIVVLTHTASDLVASPTAGLIVNAGRDRLYDAWFVDEAGKRLAASQFTVNKEAGTATLATPFSAVDGEGAALGSELYFVHRVDDMALCVEARIDGTLQLAQPLYHTLPADETLVASAVYLGDLRARVKSWRSTTADVGYDGTGTNTNAQYNLVAYPIAIDNRGSIPERWKIVFTSSTAFNLFGEKRGLVSSGSTFADLSPINPQTGTPYFNIESDGWGGGWQIGNTVRFDTDAAAAPLWLIRTVLPGQATVDDDQLKIELRGDHN